MRKGRRTVHSGHWHRLENCVPTREGCCEITSPLVSPVTSPACHFRVTSSPAVARPLHRSAEQAQKGMTELEQRRRMLAGATEGPNASYDSAIDSLPDECYCELSSSPSLSFRRSPSLSFNQQQRHKHDYSAGHMALSSLPPASASSTLGGLQQAQPYQYMASSISPSYSQMNGPILSNNSKNNSVNHNSSSHYRSLGEYHHRVYQHGHTARLSSTTSDSVHNSATSANKCSSRHSDTQLLPTSMAIFHEDHSNNSCVRSNNRKIGALSTSIHNSNGLPDLCPGTDLSGTSAIPTAAAHSSRRVATGTDSGTNNNTGRITASEEHQRQKKPSGTSASVASEEYAPHVHLEPVCSDRTDRQQVFPVHSPTAADRTTKSTTTRNSKSTATATLSASSASSSLLRSSRSFTSSYRQKANVTRKCFCLRFISLCP